MLIYCSFIKNNSKKKKFSVLIERNYNFIFQDWNSDEKHMTEKKIEHKIKRVFFTNLETILCKDIGKNNIQNKWKHLGNNAHGLAKHWWRKGNNIEGHGKQ